VGVCRRITSIEQIIEKRIQKIRQAKGYTQQQFSEMVGLSTNYLSDVERGKSSVRLGKLAAIINALECSADEVFIDVIDHGYKVKSPRIAARIEALPPDEQEKVFAVLDALNCQSKK
jgi:transcriptional regulator with XRE-family HTH domain